MLDSQIMKIGIYKDTFANNRGADIAVKNLAVGLGERGHSVTLFDICTKINITLFWWRLK